MSSSDQATVLVIIGITGDLAKRMLLPAIERIAKAGELPQDLRIVGITRRDVTAKDVLDGLPESKAGYDFVTKCLEMYQMDLEVESEYDTLKNHLADISKDFKQPAQNLFYLAVPPQISQPIIQCLGAVGFGKGTSTKLLLEKPFGEDLATAQELVEQIQRHFHEDQVYRIDHFLAKEMAQNLLVFRLGNSLFKRTWHKEFIERIEVMASEKIGIEGRVNFYEQTGALRDVVQSHLLQLAALSLMELPSRSHWEGVPGHRLEALKSLRASRDKSGNLKATRAQYKGYDKEVSNPHTPTETFALVELESTDPRWQGVPITLTTGKCLDRKYTEVRITYHQEESGEANQLMLRVSPDEGIGFSIWSKRPGYGREMESVELDYNYENTETNLPEAYERVFLDVIRSDHTLFTSSDEVLESWRILEPIQKNWEMSADNLIYYDKGSAAGDVSK